jgi:ribosomal protein S12 methylthiotransferase
VRVALVTLGCEKNTVDSERYLAELTAAGATLAESADDADIVIVNTCGFVDAAKQESLDAIIRAGQSKADGRAQTVVAIGCMVQRHREELAEALPEVDLLLGTSDSDRLIPELMRLGALPEGEVLHPGDRVFGGGNAFSRYLKVSEGCDHGCAFCAIPLMRGRHRSFALADVVREAQLLELQGARELNLVAQDLAHYGRDRRDGSGLPSLLRALLEETSIPWFRTLYLYAQGVTPEFLSLVAAEPRIVPYVDIPIQHGHDEMLKRMRRPERAKTIRERVAAFRAAVPDVAIRTTVIVGFPGETDEEFEALLTLLADVAFDRVACHMYSAQEGTKAAEMADDVPDVVKRERHERVMEQQRHITAERLERFVGRTVPVLVEALDSEPATGEPRLRGRTPWQADDIDGVTWLDGDARVGAFVEVVLDEVVDDYDYRATVRRELIAPPTPAAARPRALPVLAATASDSISAFGK